jgi:hypothetical protein
MNLNLKEKKRGAEVEILPLFRHVKPLIQIHRNYPFWPPVPGTIPKAMIIIWTKERNRELMCLKRSI